ncbi:MAG: DNA-processing protein DprA [Candidatus Nanopelagicales bacterium]
MAFSDEQLSRLALSAAFEPGDESIGGLVAEFGAIELIDRLRIESSEHDLSRFGRRWQSRDWLQDAVAELDQAADQGVEIISPGTPGWPTQLDDLHERAPLVLRKKGPLNLRQAASRSVGVVGARAATQYGIWVAEEMCAQLASEGWCVISGGAMGIDAASHRGALALAGPTVAVSAAGANLAVPASNHSLFARLFTEGAVISEVPLGANPNRRRFLVRNRVIAALAPVVVVVEAALRSGALSTMREADAMGRILCAVPGPTTSALSAGCNELIRNGGAMLVRNADDVIGEVLRASDSPECFAQSTESINLFEQRVIDLCAVRSVSVAHIAQGVGVSVDACTATLHLLERSGLVVRTVKGWRATNKAHR